MRKVLFFLFLISLINFQSIKADIFDDILNFGNSVVIDDGIDYLELDNNIVSSQKADEIYPNISYPINLLVKLKRVSYVDNQINFDFFIQNKENIDILFKILPEKITVYNIEGDKLLPQGDPIETSVNKDLEYFSFVVYDESKNIDKYKILLPIEFQSTNMSGIINFLFNDISIK